MGEPLLNYTEVSRSIHIACAQKKLDLSNRRITVSTCGIAPRIVDFARDSPQVSLAISLHAPNDALRNELVPINRKYGLEELLQACADYPGASNARRITFEYVMLDGVNDTKEDAHRLVKLLEGIPAKVNLIPFNPWPGAMYECSSPERVRAFSNLIFNVPSLSLFSTETHSMLM